jgi:thioredoxin reductase/polyferredoxin
VAATTSSSGLGAFLRTLVRPKAPEPSYPRLPAVGHDGESNIAGLYLTGEVAGTPLIKLGLNAGHEVVERIHAELGAGRDDDLLDVLIVGAGASGLGAAMRAHELGMRYVVLESEHVAMTVVKMFKGKPLFAEPHGVEKKSSVWFEECTREELLARWHEQIAETGLDVREHEKVVDLQRKGAVFEVESVKARYRARRVILAIGTAGNPRKAGVPGEVEHAERLEHSLSDPDEIHDKRVLVYGGGDVACEAAIALSKNNQVTMVTIDPHFIYPKKRNADAVTALADAGELDLHFGCRMREIRAGSAVFANASGDQREIDNDLIFEMIGAELPLGFFQKIGIKLENTWDVRRWLYLAAVSVAVYTLYALKKFPESPYSWPFNHVFEYASFARATGAVFDLAFLPFGWLFAPGARANIDATLWFQQGYLYSLVYTVLMIVFGWKAFIRWAGKAHDPRYQRYRYASLVAFQVVFFLVANVVAVQALSIQHSWRAWGLYQPWPLFFNTFHWFSDSDPRVVLYGFVGAGLVGTFVAIPLLSYKQGKRFCTWVCGCGGLAETLGDRWRHLSPKGPRSRAWEFQGLVIFVAAAIATLVTVGAFDTRADNGWATAYAYVVDFWLVAVIPIALYPFFGGKVWCRYWCPLAAYNGVLAKLYGRLRIVADDKCISCTMCSKYCQVGVDVMAFAKNGDAFDNANSACIQCGICIDVCPMSVLEFDDAPRAAFASAAQHAPHTAAAAATLRGRALPIVDS